MPCIVTYRKNDHGWWVAAPKSAPEIQVEGRTLMVATERLKARLGLGADAVIVAEF